VAAAGACGIAARARSTKCSTSPIAPGRNAARSTGAGGHGQRRPDAEAAQEIGERDAEDVDVDRRPVPLLGRDGLGDGAGDLAVSGAAWQPDQLGNLDLNQDRSASGRRSVRWSGASGGSGPPRRRI
jgi:hypothetical protein